MNWTILGVFDLVGTIAFAISGAVVGIRKKMDIFGVNVLAICTACGGGLIRDLIVGNIPPLMFRNPFYVFVAIVVANLVFLGFYRHRSVPKKLSPVYDWLLFWFDTLGLAAFTVDGVMVGIAAGYEGNMFLLVFLGFTTGVGGGAVRDIMGNQMPDILVKHVYAVASIAGGLTITLLLRTGFGQLPAVVCGFLLVLILRYLAAHFEWNLPKVH